jgi:hypothetical protein
VNSVTKKRKTKEDDDEGADEEPPWTELEKRYRVLLAKNALLLAKGTRAQPVCSFY